MARLARGAAVAAFVTALSIGVVAQHPTGTSGSGSSASVILTPSTIAWSAAPNFFPSGAELAVMEGDPGQSGPYTVRLKMPDGYRIPPHWHPTDENVTVIEGTLLVGMGDQLTESGTDSLAAGSFAKMPQKMHHFAIAQGPTTVQVHGMGPFAITYVKASDDPRNAKQ